MKERGRILIIGGAESNEEKKPGALEYNDYYLLTDVVCQHQKHHCEFVITGGEDFDETIEKYQKIFNHAPDLQVDYMIIKNKKEADDEHNIRRIINTNIVFFSGGDQGEIIEILQQSHLVDEVKSRYENDANFLVIGTSAGAMMLTKKMIVEGSNAGAQVDEYLKITEGLNIFDQCIIDTHFIQRGRFARLAHAVRENRQQIGIGLEENTALLFKEGVASCYGQGTVVLIDGREIKNSESCKEKERGYITNLKVHLLVAGCYFELKNLNINKK